MTNKLPLLLMLVFASPGIAGVLTLRATTIGDSCDDTYSRETLLGSMPAAQAQQMYETGTMLFTDSSVTGQVTQTLYQCRGGYPGAVFGYSITVRPERRRRREACTMQPRRRLWPNWVRRSWIPTSSRQRTGRPLTVSRADHARSAAGTPRTPTACMSRCRRARLPTNGPWLPRCASSSLMARPSRVSCQSIT